MSQLERDLTSAMNRCDVVSKELKDTQQELSNLQSAKRKLEAQIDEQRQQLQLLNIEVKTLKADKESQSGSTPGVYRRNDNDFQRSPYRTRKIEDQQRTSWKEDQQRTSWKEDQQRTSWKEDQQRNSYSRGRNSEDVQRAYRNDTNTMVLYSRPPELPRRDEPQVTVRS